MMLLRSRQRKRNGRTLVVVRSGKSTAVAFVNIDRPTRSTARCPRRRRRTRRRFPPGTTGSCRGTREASEASALGPPHLLWHLDARGQLGDTIPSNRDETWQRTRRQHWRRSPRFAGRRLTRRHHCGLLAMQKVVGSSPISRLETPANGRFLLSPRRLPGAADHAEGPRFERHREYPASRRLSACRATGDFDRSDRLRRLGDDWETELG
jgi:hypothetical protein